MSRLTLLVTPTKSRIHEDSPGTWDILLIRFAECYMQWYHIVANMHEYSFRCRQPMTDFGNSPPRVRFHFPWVLLTLIVDLFARNILYAENAPQTNPITNIQKLRQLSTEEAAKSYPVRLRGTVTYSDPVWNSLYLQNETGGILVRFFRSQAVPARGEILDVTGVTQPLPPGACVGEGRFSSMESGPLPTAPTLTLEEVVGGKYLGQLVEFKGVVRRAALNDAQRLQLEFEEGDLVLRIIVRDGWKASDDPARLIDAALTVRGIPQLVPTREPMRPRTLVLVHEFEDIRIDRMAPVDPFSRPVTPIAQLSQQGSQRLKIEGILTEEPKGNLLTVRDGTGSTIVVIESPAVLRKGDYVQVLGFVGIRENKLHLRDATLRILAPRRGLSAKDAGPLGDPNWLPVLQSAAEVRLLPWSEVAKNYPIRLRGTVTHFNEAYGDVFIHDRTCGIYLAPCEHPPLQQGQIIEVDGYTELGSFAPHVQQPRIRVIGKGELPRPAPLPRGHLSTGEMDSQWVEVEGVITAVQLRGPFRELLLATERDQSSIVLPVGDLAALEKLIDARVRVRGVYVSTHTPQGDVIGFRIYATDPRQIRVLKSPPSDPFALPLESIGRLSGFQPGLQYRHRTRIRGLITAIATPSTFYLQDGAAGILIAHDSPLRFQSGDPVEVVGFPIVDNGHPRLRFALIRAAEPVDPIVPRPTTSRQIQEARTDSVLIQVEGFLLEYLTEPQRRLRVYDLHTSFDVLLPADINDEVFRDMSPATHLRITGICQWIGDKNRDGDEFAILLRSPADIQVIQRPAWWTARRLTYLVSSITGVLLLSIGGTIYLRRQVHRQTHQIADQLRREANLEERFRDLFEHASDAIFSIDLDGRLTAINAAGERLLDVKRADALGQRLEDLLVSTQESGTDKLLSGTAPSLKLNWQTRKGRTVIVEVNSRLRIEDGQVAGVEAIARDVTERNRLEEQLRQSQKMEAIGRLAGGIAHDFNNLLTVINGNCSLLRQYFHPGDEQSILAAEIGQAGERAAALTRQLLAFSRKSVLAPRTVQLNTIIREVEVLLRRVLGENISLIVELDPHLMKVRVDPNSMSQVLMNLAVNARDAMPRGGKLTIRTFSERGLVCLEVSDTGIGMDEATLGRLFEPYFTTKPQGQGTGLGLASVFAIIEQSQGTIRVDSILGKGTTFRIELPIATATLTQSGEMLVLPLPISRHERILLVEDDPSVALLEKRVLEGSGYTVQVANHGAEALELLEQDPGPWHLLMTDVVMPEMSGRELAEAVSLRLPGIKILYLSGYTNDEVIREGVYTDTAHFLQKPFSPSQLLQKIGQVLGQPNSSPIAGSST